MKKSAVAWAAALALALALTGCSAGGPVHSDALNDGRGPAGTSADPNRGSAGFGDPDSMDNPTPSIRPTPDVNDAEDGGGAGGTNDVDNDGRPETKAQARAYDRAHGGIDDEGRVVDNGDSAMDDVGSAVGDAARGIGDGVGGIVRGAGNAIRDAGDAVGDAVTGR